jgi:hypothetical protein
MLKYFSSLALLFIFLAAAAPFAFAADNNCKPLYGGGATTQQVCGNKISTPTNTTLPKATPTPYKITTGGTTKGGLPVLSPTPTTTTPSTGPEILGIIALFPAGALGYYLRKKA